MASDRVGIVSAISSRYVPSHFMVAMHFSGVRTETSFFSQRIRHVSAGLPLRASAGAISYSADGKRQTIRAGALLP